MPCALASVGHSLIIVKSSGGVAVNHPRSAKVAFGWVKTLVLFFDIILHGPKFTMHGIDRGLQRLFRLTISYCSVDIRDQVAKLSQIVMTNLRFWGRQIFTGYLSPVWGAFVSVGLSLACVIF